MNLTKQLSNTALKMGDRPAYYFMDKQTTYQELDAAVTKFASGLAQLGIKQGDHIALLLGNTPHYVIGLYGALRLGATVIPINPIYTPEEIGYIIKNGDVKAVVMLDQLVPLVEKMHSLLPDVEHYIICETDKASIIIPTLPSLTSYPKMKLFSHVVASGQLNFVGPELDKEDVALILYTSGTTGRPKGAMLTHHNLYRNAQDVSDYLKMTGDDKVITSLPMFHVFCLTVCLNAPLMNGAVIIIDPKFSPKEIFNYVNNQGATVFAGVPTMYNFLLQYGNAHGSNLDNLRLCIAGGAAMPVSLLYAFEERFNKKINEGYGLSEASPVTCFNPIYLPRKAGSIGQSIVNVENKIVDEFGNEVPVGEVGELIVRGPNVMKGYYKLPEETAAALKDGWLYTGDMARMDEEGYFFIVDRKKEMIIVGGYNVYPREVEEVFYSHPEVIECAIIGVPHPEQGEEIRCFIVLKNDQVTKEELFTYAKERLAKYKVPSSIEFIDELPKNTTGKILRRELKTLVQQ